MYIPASGTLSFGPNETMKQIVIEIIDDDEFDPDKEFYIRLSNVTAYSPNLKVRIEDPSAIVKILDNDHGGIFEFDSGTLEISETVHIAEIKVNHTWMNIEF